MSSHNDFTTHQRAAGLSVLNRATILIATATVLIAWSISPGFAMAASFPERRVWRDGKDNILIAEYYGITDDGQVRLYVDGEILTFPLSGFSKSDQDWVQQQEARNQPPETLPQPPPRSEYRGVIPPTRPSVNGPLHIDDPPGNDASAVDPIDALRQQVEQNAQADDDQVVESDFKSQLQEVMADDGNRRFVRCRKCRTEFNGDAGLKPGDMCPHCSSVPFQFTGREIRATIAFLALFFGLIGWAAKQLFRDPPSPRDQTYQY